MRILSQRLHTPTWGNAGAGFRCKCCKNVGLYPLYLGPARETWYSWWRKMIVVLRNYSPICRYRSPQRTYQFRWHGRLRDWRLTSIVPAFISVHIIIHLPLLFHYHTLFSMPPWPFAFVLPLLQASEILAHILASPAVVLAAQHFTQQPLKVISIQNPGLPIGDTREIEGRESVLTTSSVYVAQGERAAPLPQHVQVS